MLDVNQRNITGLFHLPNTLPLIAFNLLIGKQMNMPEFRLGNMSRPVKGDVSAKGFWPVICLVGKKETFQALGFFLPKRFNQGNVQFNRRQNNAGRHAA